MFSREFCEIFKNTYSAERLWTTASVSQTLFSKKRFNIYKLMILTWKTVLLNSVPEFIDTEVWLLLTFFLCLLN